MAVDVDPFRNRHKFVDDVWGEIKLNDLERDVIDTPEFQRLFRTSQMGFVDLVYQTANHSRGSHSIGACHIADELVDRLNQNTGALHQTGKSVGGSEHLYADFNISFAERILIRLGALLHDISHVPLSHDTERKTHRFFCDRNAVKMRSWYGHYDKHDDYDVNPLLYLLICDPKVSVLARVLTRYSKVFGRELLKSGATPNASPNLAEFTKLVSSYEGDDWKADADLLPQLLFHLLVWEKPTEAKSPEKEIVTSFDSQISTIRWHLGPHSLTPGVAKTWHNLWYQPFRHDIIGNTLSADLIDYLTRDPSRLGSKRRIDLHLLNYYVLVRWRPPEVESESWFRCAIDLSDRKRGTTRMFLLNDLFRLLDLRQEIHEKAVVHRVVQSANAMLSRGLLLLKAGKRFPSHRDIVGFGQPEHALHSEDIFLFSLLQRSKPPYVAGDSQPYLSDARRIFEKLIERRVYRPLMVVPGDRVVERLPFRRQGGDGADFEKEDRNEVFLRTFASIIDSAYYSPFLLFVCYCVEKYLEGFFDQAAELCDFAIKRVAGETVVPEFVDKARHLIPSRVLIWSSPYKQLYKDPAVVVSLDGCVGQLDEIYLRSFTPPIKESSTRERILNAIRDADSKYATLWRLYVFISDGLFYSGLLNKLLERLKQRDVEAGERDQPLERLHKAKSFLTIAFETLCIDWSDFGSKHPKAEDQASQLNSEMDDDGFKKLVGLWALRAKNPGAEDWSTVDVEYYAHNYSLTGDVNCDDSRRCRDTRYKFDVSAVEIWKEAEQQQSGPGYDLITFLHRCGLDDPQLLSHWEFKELSEMYARADVAEQAEALLQQSEPNPALIAAAIKRLWFAEFLEEPRISSVETESRTYPKTPEEIRQWLTREGELLGSKRLASRDWNRANEQMVAFIANKEVSVRAEIFEDLRARIRNETKLFWNNIKKDQILMLLSKKWP
jgi:hypothetical protein